MKPGTEPFRTKANTMNSSSHPFNTASGLSLSPALHNANGSHPGNPQGRTAYPVRRGRPTFFSSEMGRLLTISMLFSCILLAVRIIHTGRSTFIFLTWNLFLAFLPYLISDYLSGMGCFFREKCLPRTKYLLRELDPSVHGPATATTSRNRRGSYRKPLFIAASLAWLLFIPNSFYILTDLFHLRDWYNDGLMPNWYDLVMILSFAWNGLLLGVLSLRQMEKVFLPLLPAHNELFFLYPVMWLNALGVYIGRYLRFNTWDVITNPFELFGDIAVLVMHPLRNQYAWNMIFCFSVLMTLIYLMLKKIGKALV
jgi:uncharacterized membrane protein